ncbi:leucine rich repeat protein, putative [Eimeria praecox]|uniref:Leucine rich repeat protein, putative n=1 Tax=Eimeria praecox TaxID=51316 RepID=U6GL51_9EIME|nr:leucine rich repeat protein, putative [Eimeria praecox]
MCESRTRLFPHKKVPSVAALLRSAGGVSVGPILNAAKLKALLLADGNSARKWKALDLSNSNIRKIELSLGEVAALDFECLTHLDLNGNLLVSLDGHTLPFPHLQVLRASNCRINTVTNFGSHFRLRQLDISGNQLTNIINLSNTPLRFTLRELNLARNQISEFKGLAPLSTFSSLEILDLRQNPLCNFGNVAEGFALICCTNLCQLNGHTVSPGVREAVEAWALDEPCGRATVATVEAFREALQHPEGPSLLCATSHPPMMGRLNKMRSATARSELSCNGTANASVNCDADLSDAVYPKERAPKEEGCRPARSYSCLHSEVKKGLRTVMTRAVPSASQTPAESPPEKNIGSGCFSSDPPSLAPSCAAQQCKKATELCQACAGGKCKQRNTDCPCDGLPDSLSGAPVLLKRKTGMVQAGSQLDGFPEEQCKVSLRQTIIHIQDYHNASGLGFKAGGAHTKAASLCECRSANRERLTCCAGTQTPIGWMRPLEYPSSSSSSEGSADCDGIKCEEGALWKISPPTQPADDYPTASPKGREALGGSPRVALEKAISEQEALESVQRVKKGNAEEEGTCKMH